MDLQTKHLPRGPCIWPVGYQPSRWGQDSFESMDACDALMEIWTNECGDEGYDDEILCLSCLGVGFQELRFVNEWWKWEVFG